MSLYIQDWNINLYKGRKLHSLKVGSSVHNHFNGSQVCLTPAAGVRLPLTFFFLLTVISSGRQPLRTKSSSTMMG